MRWLFGENPDIHTFGNRPPAGKRKPRTPWELPEEYNSIGEEEEMGLKRKQMIMRQKASFEHQLQARLSFLSGKGINPPKADKDTLVRKLKADIRAVNGRLRLIAANEKRTEEMAKIKADRAAAPRTEQEGGKGEKSKKAPEEGKGKKIKAEMKTAPPKAPEGGKSQKTAGSPEDGKATKKTKVEEARKEPAGPVKAEE
jgi:hypothetical protein